MKLLQHRVSTNRNFFHERLWISLCINSISNNLDIIFTYRLWHHQQNENKASKTRCRCVKIIFLITSDRTIMSYKKQNDACVVVANCLWSQSSDTLDGFYFTRITLLWAHRHFATPENTFSKYSALVNRAHFYYHGLTWIPEWIGKHTSCKVWDEITYPFPNVNGYTVKVREWISNSILYFRMDLITYPRWD